MKIKRPDIWDRRKLGEEENNNIFCFCCGSALKDDEALSDRFGRCFCSFGCERIFYGGEEL